MTAKDGIDAALWEELGAQVIVKGAMGKAKGGLNGVFYLDGKHNGRGLYKQKDGTAVIFFDQIWRFSSDDNLETFVYSNANGIEEEILPEDFWNAADPEANPPPTVVDEWLRRWSAVGVFRRLHPAKLAMHIKPMCDMLKDTKDLVRLEAMNTLGRLVHSDLESIANIIVEHIPQEPKDSVREAAVKVLIKLDGPDLAKHAHHLLPCFEDESNFVRLWALIGLSLLEIDELAKYEGLLDKLRVNDSYLPLREKANQMIQAYRQAVFKRQQEEKEL